MTKVTPTDRSKNMLRSTILFVINHHTEHVTQIPIVTKNNINKAMVPHNNNPNLILSSIFYFKF